MGENKSKRGVDLNQGEFVELLASAARDHNSDGNGAWIAVQGERKKLMFILDVTDSNTDAADTLDVFIDVRVNGTHVLNLGHFTQIAGNASPLTYIATVLPKENTSNVNVTADAAAGTFRPEVFGSEIRARWAIADSGDANSEHTFSVGLYAL